MKSNYSNSVFINCPFESQYLPIFRVIIFTVFDCGYIARCAREIDDSSEVRIDKITRIISECKYGIHDVSRTEPDKETNLPRFNMPFELGMFLGAKRFGDDKQKKKICLILDKAPYRYHSFISDIAGQDIQSHSNKVTEAIRVVREWLNNASKGIILPGGKKILERYRNFTSKLPALCEKVGLTSDEIIFNDYTAIIYEWLKENPSFPIES
ncbi:MAG: hypothetical protein GTO45_14935 [Candidatus Aminicenantes bacterium]|nr:hypothetical protein [Candidatus Aminicenantes bacterium]NIM80059.1 hypothetical protein [Candidatus Aminicenantes bacterium]NIN19402.1 hypothetical protein [Candidatus Aminicenantes bacterium]NIN43301.1 hypothetical protein [Candidatus Aminicenantes bacterium]NIN86045.1 hypothetical protein [Candidatus Aminicenantes bacterium]